MKLFFEKLIIEKQFEQILEEQLATQLQKLGCKNSLINDEAALLANLKTQLEKHNNITFSKTDVCVKSYTKNLKWSNSTTLEIKLKS